MDDSGAARATRVLCLSDFCHVAATREEAEAEARSCLQPFIERMRSTTPSEQPDWTAWLKLGRMIEDSLIGTITDIRDKILKNANGSRAAKPGSETDQSEFCQAL